MFISVQCVLLSVAEEVALEDGVELGISTGLSCAGSNAAFKYSQN